MPSLLRLALDSPLHLATDREFERLAHWLEETQWQRQEQFVAETTEKIYAQWVQDRQGRLTNAYRGSYQATGPPAPAYATPPTQIATWTTLTIKLPVWVPEQYAKPFIERQIREQLEDWDQLDERSSDS